MSHRVHPDPAVCDLVAEQRAMLAAELEARVERYARAGGGIYTRDFVNGVRHALELVRTSNTLETTL